MCRIKIEELKGAPEVREVMKKDGSGAFEVFRFEARAWVDMKDHTSPRTGLAVVETTSRKIRDAIAKADGFEFEAHRLNLKSGTVFSIKVQDNPAFQRNGAVAGSREPGADRRGIQGPTNCQRALGLAVELWRARSAEQGVPDDDEILETAERFLSWLEGGESEDGGRRSEGGAE
jgi:hypothetical protein